MLGTQIRGGHLRGRVDERARARLGRWGVATVPSSAERIGLPDVAYRPLRNLAGDVDVLTLSRPDELAGPVRGFVRTCERLAGA